jgi:DNA-binding NtrC family response regulator
LFFLVSRRTNVLLVDDDSGVRQSLEKALKLENFHVLPASNRKEAVQNFGDHDVDVVLLDMDLGPENGLDTFQHLRAMEPLVPVIIMTAHSDARAILASHDIQWILEKPLNLPVLFDKLAEVAAESGLRRQRS